MERLPKMNRSKKIIVAVSVAILLIIISILYFRTPNSDYLAVQESLKAMETTKTGFIQGAATIKKASNINDGLITAMSNLSGQYSANLFALTNSSVIATDTKIDAVFEKNKDTLKNYETEAKSLINSLTSYYDVTRVCSELDDKISQLSTLNEFNDAAKACNTAISDAKSASYTEFNQIFLTEYLAEMTAYISEYQKVFASADKKMQNISLEPIYDINERITKLNERELDLKFSQNPTAALQELLASINNQ